MKGNETKKEKKNSFFFLFFLFKTRRINWKRASIDWLFCWHEAHLELIGVVVWRLCRVKRRRRRRWTVQNGRGQMLQIWRNRRDATNASATVDVTHYPDVAGLFVTFFVVAAETQFGAVHRMDEIPQFLIANRLSQTQQHADHLFHHLSVNSSSE